MTTLRYVNDIFDLWNHLAGRGKKVSSGSYYLDSQLHNLQGLFNVSESPLSYISYWFRAKKHFRATLSPPPSIFDPNAFPWEGKDQKLVLHDGLEHS